MKPNFEDITLNVTNGYNGEVFVLHDFFKYSFNIRKEILAETVLPLIEDYKNVYITIGYKNT